MTRRRRRILAGCSVFLCLVVALSLAGAAFLAPSPPARWTLVAVAALYALGTAAAASVFVTTL